MHPCTGTHRYLLAHVSPQCLLTCYLPTAAASQQVVDDSDRFPVNFAGNNDDAALEEREDKKRSLAIDFVGLEFIAVQ